MKQILHFEQVCKYVQNIDGWLYLEEAKRLFNLARQLPNNALIVEIGSFKGKSTVCLGYACLGSNKKVVAIDLFESNSTNKGDHQCEYYKEFLNNIEKNKLNRYIIPIKGNSKEIAQKWAKPIDMIFIDGSHEYQDVLIDFRSFYPFVKKHGVIAFHDVWLTAPGPLLVWTKEARHKLYNIQQCDTLAFGFKEDNSIIRETEETKYKSAYSLYYWANCLLLLNNPNFEEVLSCLEDASKYYKHMPNLNTLQAFCLLKLNKLKEAQNKICRELTLYPKNKIAHFLFIIIKKQNKDLLDKILGQPSLKKIAIFGTKRPAEIVYEICNQFGIEVLCWIDDFEKGEKFNRRIVQSGEFIKQ